MKTRKRISLVVAVIFTVLTVAGSALAWNGHGKQGYGKRGGGWVDGPMCRQWAQLTDAQRDQIQGLRQQFKDDSAEIRIALVSRKEQVKILMGTSSPDKAKLQSLINEMADLKKEMMKKKLDMALAVKKIAPELEIPLGHGRGFLAMGEWGNMKMNKNRNCRVRGMQANCPSPFKKFERRANCPAFQSGSSQAPAQTDEAPTE